MSAKIRILLLASLAGCLWLAGLGPTKAATPGTNASTPKVSIPYVPTRHDTVRDLLWLADVGTNDVVYDLGSGDGRVVLSAVRDFHARRAVGIELDAKLVQASREKAVQAGVADRVEFIQGDLFTNDFSAASVVVLYLGHRANLDLRAQVLRVLKPGARVASHQFGMGEWTPDKTLDVRTPLLGMYGERWNAFKTNSDVPDFDNTGSRASHDVLSTWVVPAPVAGIWRGKLPPESGGGELKLTLHQRLSGLSGTFQLQGPTSLAGSVRVDLWGDHLRCWCIPTNQNAFRDQMWVDGRVQGDALTGGLRLLRGTNTVEVGWVAQRDRTDFIGTWEWPGSSNAPVHLKLERRDGRLTATYADQNRVKNAWVDETKPVPVFDLYDFQGGFYFTLLLGLEGNKFSGSPRRMGPADGWVIGEAVMENGTLRGTIAFYPYSNPTAFPSPRQAGNTAANPPSRHDWQPKRVEP